MNQSDELRKMVATMMMMPPDQMGPDTSLADLETSLGGAKLQLGLKRLGLSLTTARLPATFGELERALSGESSTQVPPSPDAHEIDAMVTRAHATQNQIQVGVDVQDVRALPMAADYWEHEFYTGMFANSEIAYAVVQTEPRIHLAGFWCAKEALRKCDPSFLKIDFASIAVAHEETGRPYLLWQTPAGPLRLPHALSLSHTGELATATVIVAKLAPGGTLIPATPQPAESPMAGGLSPQSKTFLAVAAALILGNILTLLILHFWK